MPETMGDRIRICREKRGVSQTWLANALGVDRSTIFRYEKGMTGRIQQPTVEKIAALLETEPAYLYYGSGPMSAAVKTDPEEEDLLQAPSAAYRAAVGLEAAGAYLPEYWQGQAHFVIRVETDALSPRIHSGDLLIFAGCRTIAESGVYLLWSEDGPFLSRVTVEDGVVLLQPGVGDRQTLYTLEQFRKTVQTVGRAVMLESDRP